MSRTSLKPGFITAIASLAVAAALFGAPQSIADLIRSTVRDIARPGQSAMRIVVDWSAARIRTLGPQPPNAEQLQKLTSELDEWKLRCRQLQIKAALRNQEFANLRELGPAPFQATASEPLVVPELVQAAVLGEETAAWWRAGKLLDKGRTNGISESSLVLEDERPLIDQGKSTELATGQPVYSGRCVVGKIARVGRWTSTVQLVTDPEFRALVQLARLTANGAVFGAEGILEGQGDDHCVLKLISSTEPVRVGQEVYSGGRDATFTAAMFYGTVVKAELKPGATHWEISVEPAIVSQKIRTVQVLRKAMNPLRVLGQ